MSEAHRTADNILFNRSMDAGWDEHSRRVLLERYLDNQNADDAFEDFLQEIADETDQTPDDIRDNDAVMVDAMTRYIDRQDANDAFADFLDEQVAEEEAMATNPTL